MKKIVCFLMLLMATSIFTVQSQTPIFSEDFDSDVLTPGWTMVDADNDGFQWISSIGLIGAGNGHNESNGCYSSQSYDNNYGELYPDNWLITPGIPLTAASLLSYWVAPYDDEWSAEHYAVYISTTYTGDVADFDESDFTLLFGETLTANGDDEQDMWQNRIINLSNYTGQTVYIAFRHYNCSNMYYLNLDDVEVSPLPAEPTLYSNISVMDFSSLRLNESRINTAAITAYNLSSDITATTAAPFSVSGDGNDFSTSTTLDQNGGTLYVRYTPTEEGESEELLILSSSGLTDTILLTGVGIDCNISLPLFESFESEGTLLCWTLQSMNEDNNILRTDEYSSDGDYALAFSSYDYANNFNQYLITPELPTTEAKFISFDYLPDGDDDNETFRVGYSTTSNEISAFIWGEEVTANNSVWEHYSNSSIPNNAKYVAINYSSYWNYYLYIDNIFISALIGCIPPTNLTVTGTTAHTAGISWIPAGNTSADETFTVEYAPEGSETWVTVTTSNAGLTLDNLLANTTYHVRLSIDCNNEIILTTSFTTDEACGTPTDLTINDIAATSAVINWIPSNLANGTETYHIEYAAMDGEWQEETTTGNEITLSNLEQLTVYHVRLFMDCEEEGHSDTLTHTFVTKCFAGGELEIGGGSSDVLYFPTNCTYNFSYTQQIYLSDEIGDAAPIHSISFEIAALGSSYHATNRNLKIYLMHTESTTGSDWLDANNAQLVYSNQHTVLTSGWNTFSFTTPFSYDGNSNLAVIVIDSTGNWGNGTSWKCHSVTMGLSRYVYSDNTHYSTTSTPYGGTISPMRNNVIFGVPCDEEVSCVAPNAHISGQSGTTITVNWAPGYQETAWQVQYKVADEDDWTTAIESTSEQTYTIENLQPSTQYNVRVGSICGSDYAWGAAISATTPCLPIQVTDASPFIETFNMLTSNIPTCWDNQEGTVESDYYRWGYYHDYETDDECLSFDSYLNDIGLYNILKTPSLDLSQVTNPRLTFSYKNPAGGDFSVYLSTNGSLNGATPIATGLTGVSSWTVFTYDINLTNNENVVILFKGTSNFGDGDAYIYLDNVRVGAVPTCTSPEPNSVTFSNIQTHSVTVSFVDNDETHDSWILYYKRHDDTESEWIPVTVLDEPTITLVNLDPQTDYDVEVVTNCGEVGVSDPTYPKSFTTAVACYPPTDLQITNITTTQAIASWNGDAESYTVVCGDFSTTVEYTTAIISGLTAATTYTVKVIANCGSDGFSDTASTIFMTECDVIDNFPYTEGFENGFGCWINQTIINHYTWNIDYSSSYSHNGLGYAYFTYFPGSRAHLISPTFDLSNVNDPYVSFHYWLRDYQGAVDSFVVNYRTSAESEWVRLASYTSASNAYQMDSLALPNPTATYQICFTGYGINGNGTILDDITVNGDTTSTPPTPPTPPTPELPTVTTDSATAGQTTASLYGTINNPDSVDITAMGFQYRITIGGVYTDVDGILSDSVLSAFIDSLTPNMHYTYRAYISYGDTTVYGETAHFSTLPAEEDTCATPTGLNTTDITKESVKVIWDYVEGVTWHIQYRQGDGAFSTADANTNSYVITDLNPETTYEIQVQADCGNGNVSAWATTTATTLADGVNNYLENSVVLYPNPAKEAINVQCTMNEWNGATIEVLDVYGKLLQTLKADSEITQINVSNLANGMYFVRMTTEQGVVTKRFVKK